MAAILQRQPLTIKQQVEELKHWHKQQQSKLNVQTLGVSSDNNKIQSENFTKFSCNPKPNEKINFDEIPIKVASNNFNTIVENNVAPTDSGLEVESRRPEVSGSKPKFSFLKKGEGIARFKMGPPKIAKKIISQRQNVSLKLTKDSTKTEPLPGNKEPVNKPKDINSKRVEEIGSLKAPDLKLNITWKSILSSRNPEDMLEKAISSNQLEFMDPNSSIDSSTASLMEKLLAVGKNKLSRDREELRVFEAIEQHMLDSSFCSTSSYVNKLMENAVISTPNKEMVQNLSPQTLTSISKNYNQLANSMQNGGEGCNQQMHKTVPNPPRFTSVMDNHEKIKISDTEEKMGSNHENTERINTHPVATWTKPGNITNQEYDATSEQSIEDLEPSLHVRFAEQVDYKSFVEQSQSIDSVSHREENASTEFDESQEWKEDSGSSSSCCSQCSNHDSSDEDVRPFNTQEKQLQNNPKFLSQKEKNTPSEILHVRDLKTNDMVQNNDPSSNGTPENFPPILLEKLKELEGEINIFRVENDNIRALRESLEKERKAVQEEKRRLNLEKKKFQKEIEEERNRLTTQFEEEKQKLAKEKSTFEKYSKSLTKNPSREERKEIQALREQLVEIKEELNKKESRWGAAQARVRNQVKVLEQDNQKLREEIENFRKQAKYWELFNQKKKGKPFNNTRLIHAISEHISNIVLDEGSQEKVAENNSYFNQNSTASKTSTVTQSDLKSMYGVRIIKENKKSTLPNNEDVLKQTLDSSSEDVTSKRTASKGDAANINRENNSSNGVSDSLRVTENIRTSNLPVDRESFQNEDRCQKPHLEENSSNVIKEVTDDSGNVEITFPNGNVKKVNKITGSEKYIYINGDVEEITHDGTVKYYFSKSRIWQTTLPDGLEIVDFSDGKVEKRHIDGTVEIIYSNNNKKISYPNGSQEIIYTDGTRLKIEADKTHILTLPNGQKEIHTEEWKRREYPDGTMKTLYPDGTTETVYANGRVRLKDKYGNLVMDSGLTQNS